MKKVACLGTLLFTLGLLICIPAAAQTDGSCTDCERFDEYVAYCGDYDGNYVNCQNVCYEDICQCRSQTSLGGCTVDANGNHHFYPKYQALLITPDEPFSSRYTVVAARISRPNGRDGTGDDRYRFLRRGYALLMIGKSRT
jgi:hypothetical protein